MNSRMKPSSSPPPPKKVNANPKKDFNEMVSVYIDNINDGESVRQIRNRQRARDSVRHEPPVEKPLTKLNYDNVVKSLVSSGFPRTTTQGCIYCVQCEYFNETENINKMSNIRTEIPGTDLIQEYCRTNNLKKILDLTSTISAASDKIKFTQKIPPMSKNEPPPWSTSPILICFVPDGT
jgi:hypothetical protein